MPVSTCLLHGAARVSREPTPRHTTLRPAALGSLAKFDYCWVSTQYGDLRARLDAVEGIYLSQTARTASIAAFHSAVREI